MGKSGRKTGGGGDTAQTYTPITNQTGQSDLVYWVYSYLVCTAVLSAERHDQWAHCYPTYWTGREHGCRN